MIVGLALMIFSALLYNAGFVVEKMALQNMPEVHARRVGHMVRALVSSPTWLVGFSFLLVGLAFQVAGLAFLPLSVAQPVFISGIVFLLLLSHHFLGERLERAERGGIALITVAIVLIGLSLGSGRDRAGTGGTLAEILLAAVPSVAAGILAFLAAEWVGRPGKRFGSGRALLFGLASGMLYGVAALATKAVSVTIHRFGLGHALPHLLVSGDLYLLAVTSAVGLVMFQTALQRCPASIVVPVSNVTSSAYLVAVGTVIFAEQLPSEPWRLALRAAGFAMVLAGMVTLARGHGLEGAFGLEPGPEGDEEAEEAVPLPVTSAGPGG